MDSLVGGARRERQVVLPIHVLSCHVMSCQIHTSSCSNKLAPCRVHGMYCCSAYIHHRHGGHVYFTYPFQQISPSQNSIHIHPSRQVKRWYRTYILDIDITITITIITTYILLIYLPSSSSSSSNIRGCEGQVRSPFHPASCYCCTYLAYCICIGIVNNILQNSTQQYTFNLPA